MTCPIEINMTTAHTNFVNPDFPLEHPARLYQTNEKKDMTTHEVSHDLKPSVDSLYLHAFRSLKNTIPTMLYIRFTCISKNIKWSKLNETKNAPFIRNL